MVLQKVRKQGIRFWDERTFWHEIIYKSLIPTFGKPTCQNVLSSQNLIPCFLTFCSTIESKIQSLLTFEFLIFYHSSKIVHTCIYETDWLMKLLPICQYYGYQCRCCQFQYPYQCQCNIGQCNGFY